jgi:hypothetical protein
MVTVALSPFRSTGSPGPISIAILTGTLCTTFTQLPLAFWGGIRANTAPLAGLIVFTWPANG